MIGIDDEPGSAFANNIYGVWTNFTPNNIRVQFNRSINNGNTYSLPVTISTTIGQGANVQTGPTGQVYVCWADYDNNELGARGLGFCRSLNGGVTFTNSQRIFNYSGIRDLNTNTDGSSPTFNNTRINDFPAMSVDKSNGIHRGRIYVTYAAHENGNGKAIIQVAWSDNQGDTWSNPVTVNIPTGRQNWFPWIAVDNCNGEIWVDYFSFDTPSGFGTNTYVGHSIDGGLNWENQRVSDVNHITQSIVAPNIRAGYAGDYIGITAFGGRAYPIWMDNRNGTWQLYCSPVTSNLNNYSISGDNIFCTTSTNYTIPSLPAGATVQWSVTPSGIATPNTPGGTQTTLTRNGSGVITLIATISNACGSPIIITKQNIVVGTSPVVITAQKTSAVGEPTTYLFTATPIAGDNYAWYVSGIVNNPQQTGTSNQFDWYFPCRNTRSVYCIATNLCGNVTSNSISETGECIRANNYTVSPNPATSTVTVFVTQSAQSESGSTITFDEVRIYDQQGNLKKAQKANKAQQSQLNIADLISGVYVIQITDGSYTEKQQLIIQK